MKIKCNWCGSWINDFDQACPNCGAVNESFRRQGTGVPRTMAELKEWAEKHHLPLGQMRTYIGVNYTGPKAFGIYRDENTGNFIVYKNKADGTRAVRYEGPDEAYAVNELYQKMKERVADQKSRRRPGGKSFTGKIVAGFIVLQIVVLLLSVFIGITDRSPDTGYYQYHENMYYWQDATDAWYIYDDDTVEWDRCYDDLDDLYDDYDDYYVPSYRYSDYGVTDFTDSGYYVEPSFYEDDWDYDSDWDSSYDWDSGADNWDSDW